MNKIKAKIFFSISILFFLSCSNKGINTESFIDKINLESWNSKTLGFAKEKCSLDKYKYYHKEHREGYIVLSTSDTIFSVDDQIKNYTKYRRNFLFKLKEKINLLPIKTGVFVISEEYYGIDNPEISYTVFSDNMNVGLRFYYDSEEFDKIQKIEQGFKEYGYDSIAQSKPKCIVEYTGHLNRVNFDTTISINSEGEIIYEIKESYFGSAILD